MLIVLSVIFAFLCGSIPSGYLLCKKLKGIDIRTMGSGNIGSTNVKRILGAKLAVYTQIFDIAKALVPVSLAYCINYKYNIGISDSLYYCLVGFSAILGHNYTPFLSFNGGKGVNTTMGAFFLMTPIATLLGVTVYFVMKPFVKTVAIRSMSLGFTIPAVSYLLKVDNTVVLFSFIAAILLVIRHKKNIKQIIESRKSNKDI
ncbi:glycerol-3-phosphate 1-O-acyltransferase PlsY [uncultured Clostridium sp.]|uniref:glycerol-3-phosphate 1-O-acyltransferase PlsY n=1 Tax=uncultured Clostridium sp. TaxID=59620 RepID=UPI0025FA35F5|nr:glycerol-3-phosphate 1-O-acyltransferase PlsY [uncultured Clostridium sp.]